MRWTRLRCVLGIVVLAALAILITDAGPVLAQAKKSDAVVKTTATADKPDADGKQTVTITLDIEKDWHLYANPPDNEDAENAKTVVAVTSKTKPENVKVEYPPGKLHKNPLGDFKIYEGKVVIKAHVKRAKSDSGPLEVSIKMQACNAKSCLIPSTTKISVP